LRADLPGPDSTEPSGAPFLINYGADPLIGPRSLILGCGTVLSDYIYEPTRSEYRHTRKVSWLNEGNWTLPEEAHVPTKTLTEVSDVPRFLAFAIPLIEITELEPVRPDRRPYTIEQAIDDLFLTKDVFHQILGSLTRKKNAILQGPPGVGKSFIARRLAYAIIGAEDPTRVKMVQFHQSYSYEDFIQGYRPHEQGGFDRRNGVFFEFCRKAASDADRNATYVFIIDEVNRGNLSKIFGELFLLIEADKRGPKHAIPLTYSKNADEVFYVPENLYLLGMMNTADRSLAMVDFALRRRFAFVDLRPAFHTLEFQSYLEGAGVEPDIIDLVKSRMGKLNEIIRSEKTSLGPGFEIGHSFFCPQDTEETLDIDWYRSVIREEIAPLLREYWFDDPDKAEDLTTQLLA
jgi:5-methylcytosine-specific restriction protein B